MKPVDKVEIAVSGPVGSPAVSLCIELRKGSGDGGVWPLCEDPDAPEGHPRVHLLEGAEYWYEWRGEALGDVKTSLSEIFDADPDRLTGRLRPQLHTGTLQPVVFSNDKEIGRIELEVRSRKLDYLSQYRWMLRDLTETFLDVVTRRFAAGEHHFTPDSGTDDGSSLYQRFAFLQAVLGEGTLGEALDRVIHRPHIEWKHRSELRSPIQGLKPGSYRLSQLIQPGPRVAWPSSPYPRLKTLPERVSVSKTEASLDCVPNRFVKHALDHWHCKLTDLARCLEVEYNKTAPVVRGLREVADLLDKLERVRNAPVFDELRPLRRFPVDNQVLQRKEGYRAVFSAYLLAELAGALTWEGGEHVYSAGKRDVATLYEYWAYIKLIQILSDFCEHPMNLDALLQRKNNGYEVTLRSGKSQVFEGLVERKGVPIQIALWFNRTFPSGPNGLSWSRSMRPDCSLLISVAEGYDRDLPPVWVHFDAKYRIAHLRELFGDPNSDEQAIQNEAREERLSGTVKRADLLKMHAYRDAIRNSAGAYVLYPGDDDPDPMCLFEEILPGLGAFRFRPTLDGVADGAEPLRSFLNDVLDHFASRSTKHERVRYWEQAIHGSIATKTPNWLPRPPADTHVLVGYVKTQQHLRWVEDNDRYVVRADPREGQVLLDSRELAADVVVLYSTQFETVQVWRTSGDVELLSASDLEDKDYPEPKGSRYFCLVLAEQVDTPAWIGSGEVIKLARSRGAGDGQPFPLSWKDLEISLDC